MTGGVNTLAKGVVFALSALAAPFAVMVRDGLTTSELISLTVLAAGSVAVFLKNNTPTQPAAVAVVAIFTAVTTAVTAAWTDGVITPEEWATIALAFLGALGAYLTGNDTAALTPVRVRAAEAL